MLPPMANQIARHLRKNETIAEKKLWKELRNLRRQGYHFRRQAPIDAFIVDFACLSHRFVIEVDGIQHDTELGRKKDAARDAHLNWQGFTLLRFTNGEVAENIEGVIAEVLASLGVLVKQE
jgi:very-short-patch-repair endonuclease